MREVIDVRQLFFSCRAHAGDLVIDLGQLSLAEIQTRGAQGTLLNKEADSGTSRRAAESAETE